MYNTRINKEDGKIIEDLQIAKFYPSLQRYCRFLSRNQWDGDDLAQEAILKASQKYQPSQLTQALLNKIAYHQWIDTLRKREHEPVCISTDIPENQVHSNVETIMDIVNHLTNKLTPKQAVIFMLKEAFLYQANEIADLLETSEIAVKSALHRAKQRINKMEPIHSVDSFWDEEEKAKLFELLQESIQTEDPKVLIDHLSDLPSFTQIPKAVHSRSPLNSFCMAA